MRYGSCGEMDLLKNINDWVQKGFEITYHIVNQFENGYGYEVEADNMPKFTYSFHIHEKEEELWMQSLDTLEEGFNLTLQWLYENRYVNP